MCLVTEGNEVRLQVSSEGMQGTTRGSDEAIQASAVEERADLADATSALELESAKGSQNDTAENRLTTARAEE